MTWYLVFTKPQKESYAGKKLTEQGFTVYCPLRLHEKIVRQKRVIKHLPLFPRYFFIYHDDLFLAQQHTIRSTPGVSQLISTDGSPYLIDDAIIHLIMNKEQDDQSSPEHFFNHGDRVTITQGVLRDMEAIYDCEDGEHRAILLINLLHKSHPIKVNKIDLRKS